MNHPTPTEIRHSISQALFEDYEKNPMEGPVPFIPVRVHRLVSEAISRACDAKGNQQ